MNIFENFNKAKQKFGENLARQAIEALYEGYAASKTKYSFSFLEREYHRRSQR